MIRRYKGPYLFLNRRSGRPAVWVIRDGGRWKSTGCKETERFEAEAELAKYAKGSKSLPRSWTGQAPVPTIRQVTIYFISTDDVPSYPIKIGVAYGQLEDRLQTLQTACPYRLVCLLILEGNSFLERILHGQFQDARLMGEWFARTPELMSFIASHDNQGGAHAPR